MLACESPVPCNSAISVFQSMPHYRERDVRCQRLCDVKQKHDPDMETIGERLESARVARGLTQEALAKAAGVKQSTIAGIENGSRNKRPDLVPIAHALGVDAYWLRNGVRTVIAGDKRINQVVELMERMGEIGRAIMLDKAKDVAKEYPAEPKAKFARSSA